MSFRPRLSVALTVNDSPAAICCVSAAGLSTMTGASTSGWMRLGFRAVSHAPTAPASATSTHQPRTPRLCCIERSWLLPGAGRHQVVDNVRRDENQQIAPRFLLGAEAEQLPEDRQ